MYVGVVVMAVAWGGGGGRACLCSVFYFEKVEGRVAQYPFVVCFGCRRWGWEGGAQCSLILISL